MTLTPTKRRRIPAIAIAGIVLLGLLVAGFGVLLAFAAAPSDVISIPASAVPTTKCDQPAEPVAVTDLHKTRWTSCDMDGLTVIFPDGATAPIGAVGASTGGERQSPRYYIENLGTYGVVAVRVTGERKEYWGAPHGVSLVKERPSGV